VHDIKWRGKRQVGGVLKSTVRCTVSVTKENEEYFFPWFGNHNDLISHTPYMT
jgi:hypothetical protein